MRLLRALGLIVPAVWLSGCAYVHFGRLPKANDPHLQQEYLDLGVQQKVLKQELVLAHKESDTLRRALEKASASSPAMADMTRQLEATTRELATLRVNYAKLQSERAGSAGAASSLSNPKVSELQEKLAAVQRDYTRVKDENAQLRRELDNTRIANASLALQVNTAVALTEKAQSSVTQLNSELLAQKQARSDAEQATAALRAQLDAVVARANRADTSPAVAVDATTTAGAAAPAVSSLQNTQTAPSDAPAKVEFHAHVRPTTANGIVDPTPAESPSASVSAATSSGTESTNIPSPGSETAIASNPTSSSPSTSGDATPTASATSTPSTTVDRSIAANVPTIGPPPSQTYVVQKGDTLEKIATQFYGAADQWGKIYAANIERLSANQGLKPGMQIDIPPR